MKGYLNERISVNRFCISTTSRLRLALLLWGLVIGAGAWGAETGDGATKQTNVAMPEWGTQITATTVFSDQYAPSNLADGAVDGPHCWFGKDGAVLPQQVTFAFSETQRVTGMKLVQAQWVGI